MKHKTVIIINTSGKILQVVKDEIGLKKNFTKTELMVDIIKKENLDKFNRFVDIFNNKLRLINWNFSLKKTRDNLVYFSGYKIDKNEILLLITVNKINKNKLLKADNMDASDEIEKTFSDENDEKTIGKLTRLNNELINVKRDLDKKNYQINLQKNKLNVILNSLNEGVITFNRQKEVTFINHFAENHFGKKEKIIGKNITELIQIKNGKGNEIINKYKMVDLNDKNGFKEYENIFFNTPESSNVFGDINITPLVDENEIISGGVLVYRDLREKMEQKQKINLFNNALENITESLVITDEDNRIIYINNSFINKYKYEKSDILEKNYSILESEKDEEEFFDFGEDMMEKYHVDKNGKKFPVIISFAEINDVFTDIKFKVHVIRDVTEIKKMEMKLKKKAGYDELTGVYNRRAGIEFLKKYLKIADREEYSLILIFIDINNLKKVNDTMGHKTGDELIKNTSRIIEESIRASDVISRIGGDEFLVVLPNCNLTEKRKVEKRIEKKIKKFNENNQNYEVSISRGASEYQPGSNMQYDELIQIADDRMYKNKEKYYKN